MIYVRFTSLILYHGIFPRRESDIFSMPRYVKALAEITHVYTIIAITFLPLSRVHEYNTLARCISLMIQVIRRW